MTTEADTSSVQHADLCCGLLSYDDGYSICPACRRAEVADARRRQEEVRREAERRAVQPLFDGLSELIRVRGPEVRQKLLDLLAEDVGRIALGVAAEVAGGRA